MERELAIKQAASCAPADGCDTLDAEPALQARAVRWLFVFAALVSLPLLLPGDAWWQSLYGQHGTELLMLPALVAILLLRRRRAEDHRESRFWKLLATGFAAWFACVPVSGAFEYAFPQYPQLAVYAYNLLFISFYGCLIAALKIHPHVEHDPDTYPLRVLEWTGASVLLFGVLSYFLIAPALHHGGPNGFWNSTIVLWFALDIYLIAWLSYLRATTDNRSWQLAYSWLLGGVVVLCAGDLFYMLTNEGVFPNTGYDTPFELVWLVAFCAVARATTYEAAPVAEDDLPIAARPTLGMGPLVLYASLPLLMHTLLYRFGAPDPEFGPLREGVALIATVILTGMTLVYHRLVQQENRRLAAEQLMAREQLAHRAFHDELTGLPNRNLFMDRLQMAIAESVRNKQRCAVLFCDLDQFKVINDSLGHEAGDETLIHTARRLSGAVRQRDTVARLGGDEFAVVLTEIGDPQDAAHLAGKMLEVLGKPLHLAGKNHSLTASIGVAVYPDDGTTEKALLKHADTAMYQSKIHGRNTFRLFTEAMNVAAEERLAIEQGLRAGLIAEQFSVFYQPVVSLDSGCAAGYEALVRWYDPQRGYITPASFIDVAEQTGLIVPIGQWVLETACEWAAAHPPINGWPPTMSVNISARQLREPGVVDFVAGVLARTGLEPACLQLEITESVALSMESSSGVLSGLRRLGVRMAIDDFGTGHSALSRLQQMPVDAVKIDRCFVQGIEGSSVSQAIVTAIVSMANAMGITVVAEGVETESELAVIRDAGCHSAQGYYYSEPLPAEALAEKFNNARPDGTLVFLD